jgi:hypothetical protein
MWAILADAVLVLHFAIVLFVIGGLVATVVGNLRGWRWVNGLLFRWSHLAAIVVVVLQAWLGQWCVLTVLESWLRRRAGQAAYGESFIEHWVSRVMFYEAPMWVFASIYTAFALLVAAAWWKWPPRRRAAR